MRELVQCWTTSQEVPDSVDDMFMAINAGWCFVRMMHTAQTVCCAGDQQRDSSLLGSTVQSALAQAEAHGMQSMAMPLIGAGRAGWPAKLAAQIHIAEVVKLMDSRKAATSLQVKCACHAL